MPATLLRPDNCGNCKFHKVAQAAKGGTELQCHRNPAMTTFLVLPSERGLEVTKVTGWGVVNPDEWCGEHRRGVIDESYLPGKKTHPGMDQAD
jgi:hypothetical protein